MWDVLFRHLDGEQVPVPMPVNVEESRTIESLVLRGLLRKDRPYRPRWTFVTEAGRMVIAKALANIADSITSPYVLHQCKTQEGRERAYAIEARMRRAGRYRNRSADRFDVGTFGRASAPPESPA